VKEKILIIDDVLDLQETLLILLRKAGYDVQGVSSGPEALKITEETFFDLIVSDLRIPGMSGVDALIKIREKQTGRRSKMIIMSGHSDHDALIKSIHLGVDDFIKKPFGRDEFMHLIEKTITNYRLQNEKEEYVQMVRSFNEELVEKNERISAILSSLAEGVFTVDENMEITHFNRAAESIVGLKSEKVIGEKCSKIFANHLCDNGCPIKNAIKSDNPVLNNETEIVRQGGKTTPVLISASALKDSAGNVIGGVEVFRDITETKRMMREIERSHEEIHALNVHLEQRVKERTKDLLMANRKIREAQAQLMQSSKMAAIGQLGAGVAHEMNNPLTGIFGYAQMILKKFNKEDVTHDDIQVCKKYVRHIEVESDRCKSIIENLLLFSKKPVATQSEPVHINEIIHKTVTLVKCQTHAAKVNFEFDLDETLPCASGNANRFQQVFMNFFVNALKAMPQGGEIKVTSRRLDPQDSRSEDFIAVDITDTGCGIPEENKAQIFNAFFTTKEDNKSVGLGLFIVYQIIQGYQGSIEVKSEEGKGTTFTLFLKIFKE
jgi:PAS domain S-box-containing protein